MQCDDGLARARRTRHAPWAAVVPFNQNALRRMKENRPLVPGVVERALQFLDIGHHAETALGVGMRERISSNSRRLGDLWRDTGGQIQQRFGGLGRQVIREFQQCIFVRAAGFTKAGGFYKKALRFTCPIPAFSL
jgi:hypothetical protein